MSIYLIFLALIFVVINTAEIWLTIRPKSLIKGGVIMGILGALDFLLMILLFLSRAAGYIVLVFVVEVIHWLTIAFYTTRSKIK